MDGREALGDRRMTLGGGVACGHSCQRGLICHSGPVGDLRAHDLQRFGSVRGAAVGCCGLRICLSVLVAAVDRPWVWGCSVVVSRAERSPVVAGQELVLWLGLCGLAVLASRCRAESLWVFVMRGLVLGQVPMP